jgi:dolichol-phosphate mannosyltransferase
MRPPILNDVLIVLATYNERDNIVPLVSEIRQLNPTADILVVDDNSPDGTGKLVDQLAFIDASVSPLHRRGKEGLGTAIVAGLRYAIEKKYRLVVNLDADYSHNPKDISRLLQKMRGDAFDIVIGSRYVEGGGIENWGHLRRMTSRGVNWLARWGLGLTARDCSGAFRCYRVDKLTQIDFAAVHCKGYAFLEELLLHARKAGARMTEIPITFTDRKKGSSKVCFSQICLSLYDLLFVAATKRWTLRPTELSEPFPKMLHP